MTNVPEGNTRVKMVRYPEAFRLQHIKELNFIKKKPKEDRAVLCSKPLFGHRL